MSLKYTTAFVTISTHNLTTLVQFYHQLFGLAPATQIPGVYAEFHLRGLRLGIFKPRPEKAGEKAEGERQKAEEQKEAGTRGTETLLPPPVSPSPRLPVSPSPPPPALSHFAWRWRIWSRRSRT